MQAVLSNGFYEINEEEVQNINGGSVGGALVGVVLGVCDV